MSDDLKQKIKEIPGEDGFWKESTIDAFLFAGERMVTAGMEESDILEILEKLYRAVSDEYGN